MLFAELGGDTVGLGEKAIADRQFHLIPWGIHDDRTRGPIELRAYARP
jgi:hypothetical protein